LNLAGASFQCLLYKRRIRHCNARQRNEMQVWVIEEFPCTVQNMPFAGEHHFDVFVICDPAKRSFPKRVKREVPECKRVIGATAYAHAACNAK
jgi:hypothetical protein